MREEVSARQNASSGRERPRSENTKTRDVHVSDHAGVIDRIEGDGIGLRLASAAAYDAVNIDTSLTL